MKNIILADDDDNDFELFEDALQELNFESKLTRLKDGEELMKTLNNTVPPLPSVVFLDLNMPRKNGYECLAEIRNNQKLKDIMVVIFSTTDHPQAIETTYSLGSNYYICKPPSFRLLKKAIETVLRLSLHPFTTKPSRDKYYININFL